ncbi:MAG: hypothetical protein IKZ87_03970 [Actinomycetaceae bacterium]|nr:hypothetical protein [Actinomycetaceae bacterium]
MRTLLASEFLKLKHRVDVIVIMLIPFVVLLFTLLSPAYLYQEAINWWSLFFAPLTAALIGLAVSRTDRKQTQQNIVIHTRSLKQLWLAKVIVGFALFALTTAILTVFASVLGRLIGAMPAGSTLSGEILTALVLFATQAWLIPFSIFLTSKFPLPVTLFVAFVGIIGAVLVWQSSLWWLWGWAWAVRGIIPTSLVLPNGLLTQAGDAMANPVFAITAVFLGVIATALITFVSAWRFEKKYTF